MREGSRTGFRPNRARSQRVQSNSVTSLRAGSSLKGMDGRRLNSERGPPAYRYEINDLKDRCRDKLFLYCVAKRDRRRRFSDAVRALDGKDREENNPPEGHTSRAPISPGKHLSARSRPMDRKKKCRKGK